VGEHALLTICGNQTEALLKKANPGLKSETWAHTRPLPAGATGMVKWACACPCRQPQCSTLRTMPSLSKLLLLSFAIGAGACTAIAQDPTVAFPKNYSLALDNEFVSVIRVHYGPHEHIGVHDHSRFPTIYVYLSDSGQVRFEHDEKPPFRLTRPPTTTGAFRVSPGRIERHAVENLSDQSSDFLRVELKQVPLGSSLQAFRGKAPSSPLQSGRAVEFRSPEVDVQRFICEHGTPCNMDISGAPSLLITFSPLKIMENDAAEQGALMTDGDVKSLRGPRAVSMVAVSSAPAHLLWITLKAGRSTAEHRHPC
jgi:hypothetical protein